MLLRVGRTISASNISASNRSSGNVRRALVSGQAAALARHAGASSQARFPSFGQWAILPERGAERPPGRGCLRGDPTVHCVLWSYPAPAGLSKERANELFAQTAQIYVGVPGLVRKYFGYSEDGSTIVGVYLWRSKADADAFYSPDWIAGVRSRWGVMPAKSEWYVPQVVESAEGRVITEKAPAMAEAV
jgi:hypothetical protein